MNLEELKSAWQVYDRKLQASQTINEKLIFSMIRERSNSRVSRLKRDNTLLMLFMFLEIAFLVAVFAGNPFDFKFLWQYVPFLFILVGNLMGIIVLFRVYKMLKTDITNTNLRSFLKNLIETFEKNKKAEGWFGAVMFVSGCLTVFSFLPHKLETKSLLMAIVDTLIPLAISVILYLIAYKMGAFKNQKEIAFRQDLSELETLQRELQEN